MVERTEGGGTTRYYYDDRAKIAAEGEVEANGSVTITAAYVHDSNGKDFIGRIDNQAKIRGYRIETGEVEAKLLSVGGVKEAVVVVREDQEGQKALCAYYTAEEGLTAADLKRAIASELPGYMIPSYFVELERLPLTPLGIFCSGNLIEDFTHKFGLDPPLQEFLQNCINFSLNDRLKAKLGEKDALLQEFNKKRAKIA
ncbi:hypothetical protein ABU162_30360 [Paenibacillus thiaminolyticus]